MNLRAILFDLDDTLHDKSATLRVVAARQFEEAGLASRGVSRDQWEAQFLALNNTRIEKTEVFARLRGTFALPDALAARLLDDFDTNLGAVAQPCAGALELLAAARGQGLKVGIVTNGRDAFQRSKIAGMGVAAYVDATVTSGAFGAKKPDHRIFTACLDELDAEPSEAAFVGDDFEADMEPAIALGLHAVWKSKLQSPRVAFCAAELPTIHAYLLGMCD